MQKAAHDTPVALACRDLTVVAGGRLLVDALSFTLRAGEWLAVLGRNGVGKTLTLQTLCGLREAGRGDVQVLGCSVRDAAPRTNARQMTLVTQHQDDAFAASVADNVLLGRYPHLGLWRRESASDRRLASRSLEAVDLASFGQRDITTLSGGERQRTAIAQALTQDTPLLMLDEPLSHLDPAHALAAVRLFEQRVNTGYTLITSLHDVNIANRFASHALLLYGDGRWRFGSVRDTLSADSLSELYGAPMLAIGDAAHTWYVPDTTG